MDRPRRITSLDFGELDELLDDINCDEITMFFDDKRQLSSIRCVCYSTLNDHIIKKMEELYNLKISMISGHYDDLEGGKGLSISFDYIGNYKNKAEYRKQLEQERMNCGGWTEFKDGAWRWKIKKGMHKKYKALCKELKNYG